MNVKEKMIAFLSFTSGAIAMGFLLFSLLALSQNVNAAEFLGADTSVWIEGEHTNHDQASIVLGAGLEWQYFTFRIGHGIKKTEYRAIGEPEWDMDEWQSGSIVALLWHPLPDKFIRPHLILRHASDITRGKPFNDKNEPSSDFLGIGVKLGEDFERIEFDFEYGLSAIECDLFDCTYDGNTSWQARVAIRVVLWK